MKTFEESKQLTNEFFRRDISKDEYTLMRILHHAFSKNGIINEGTISEEEEETIIAKWVEEGHITYDINNIVIKDYFAKLINNVFEPKKDPKVLVTKLIDKINDDIDLLKQVNQPTLVEYLVELLDIAVDIEEALD